MGYYLAFKSQLKSTTRKIMMGSVNVRKSVYIHTMMSCHSKHGGCVDQAAI